MSDHFSELLVHAQQGDAEAFKELYVEMMPIVRDFIVSRDGQLCAHEHEDLTQTVFVAIWEGRANFKGNSSAKTFVLSVAKNLLSKVQNRRRIRLHKRIDDVVQTAANDAAAKAVPSKNLAESESVTAIRKAMTLLPEKQREVIELYLIHDLPRAEILRLANCTPQQFADRLYRAKLKLRNSLADLFPHA